jgi:hypothetical protein
VIEHLDENEEICARHAPSTEGLLLWAAIGARISGFHHDSASKLQSLMMALDEAVDLLGHERQDVRRVLDTAMTSLRELHGLLTENRALVKAPQRELVPLADILRRASARHGVTLSGDPGTSSVHVAPPSIVHAIALLCDQTAGPSAGARVVALSISASGESVTIELSGTPSAKPLANASETIAVATFLLRREDGSLRCTPRGFIVQLPLAASTDARSAGDKP